MLFFVYVILLIRTILGELFLSSLGYLYMYATLVFVPIGVLFFLLYVTLKRNKSLLRENLNLINIFLFVGIIILNASLYIIS